MSRYRGGVGYGDIDLVADCGADPTWRTYSDTAFAQAVRGAQPGQTIGIPPGLYKTKRPIIAPPYVGWQGSVATPLVGSWAEYGSVIKIRQRHQARSGLGARRLPAERRHCPARPGHRRLPDPV